MGVPEKESWREEGDEEKVKLERGSLYISNVIDKH
jgi:hypothetical protein